MESLNLNRYQLSVLLAMKDSEQRTISWKMNKTATPMFWREIGATISLSNRQVGKTTLANYFKHHLGSVCLLVNGLRPLAIVYPTTWEAQDMTLVVDEFLFLARQELNQLLNFQWKAVVLLGSLGD